MIKNLKYIFLYVCFFLVVLDAEAMKKAELNLTGYQERNGAITVGYRGDFVDPYFALRALLLAHEEGLDTRKVAIPWIRWLIQKQRHDGRFDRYSKINNVWVRSKEADADDILLALWVELLEGYADDPALPVDWKKSSQKAFSYLQNNLYDSKIGIYYISVSQPVGLFMDNVEIARAFLGIASFKEQKGDLKAANYFRNLGQKLIISINKCFWNESKKLYEVSTQSNQTHGLYPGAVAQIYPWAFSVDGYISSNKENFIDWYEEWNVSAQLKHYDYPWGLIAIAAIHSDYPHFAYYWQEWAQALRHTSRWNVLEEAVYQDLSHNLKNIREMKK